VTDFNSSLPCRTQSNGDIVSVICDATVTTQTAKVSANGELYVIVDNTTSTPANVNLAEVGGTAISLGQQLMASSIPVVIASNQSHFPIELQDGSGNAITSQVNNTQRALDVGINVLGVQIDPRQIRTLTSSDVVTANQGAAGASAWLVKDSADGPVAPGAVASFSTLIGAQYNSSLPSLLTTQQSALQCDSSGRLLIGALPTSSNTIGNVGVTNLPTTVDVNYGTVGNSTIRTAAEIGNNLGQADFNAGATGAQTLRVVANQGAANTAANAWFQKITDGTNTATVKAGSTAAAAADTAVVVALSPNSPVPAGTNLIGAVNLDIGSAAVSASNPVPVSVVSSAVGTPVNKYNTTVNVAVNGVANHIYTITTGKTFSGRKFWASGSGKIRADVQTSPDGSTYSTYWTAFNSTSSPNISIDLDNLVINDSGTGATIRIQLTNYDKNQFDVFSTISGSEN
jgi:hypothetical protein